MNSSEYKSKTKPSTFSFMKYTFFFIAFIISFSVMNMKTVELFGLGLFFTINILFCILIGKDLIDGSISPEGTTEWMMKYGLLIVSIAFSLVSSIMMIMTFITLQSKFAESGGEIKWSHSDRKKLDDTKILFVVITTFIGVVALYVYNTPNDIRKGVYNILDFILNGQIGDWARTLFPIVLIGLGSALYGRLEMKPVEVRKRPKQVFCDPLNDPEIQDFKKAFIKSYWCLFLFLLVIFARPFIEANFNIFGISPSSPFGFSPGDRSFIFGQNPSISLLSLMTFGISNLMKMNDVFKVGIPRNSIIGYTLFLFLCICVWTLILFSIGTSLNLTPEFMIMAIFILFLSVIAYIIFFVFLFEDTLSNMFLSPIVRWDVIYNILKYGFGLAGLVYAGYSFKHFIDDIPDNNPCLFMKSHIRQLYIAFIFFLIALYTFNTFSVSVFTSLMTTVMRYLVPPTLLASSSYLVFITNYFVNMAPKLVVQ
jgi:hypothetical protein